VWLWRYVSLGSLAAAFVLPLAVWALGALGAGERAPAPLLTTAAAGAALIVYMHRANIGRLRRGEESRFKF
jgi:glycerol-3-phosphate acyltransferase PlsY